MRTIARSRRWARKLLIGSAAAAVVTVGAPTGGAVAAQPMSHISPAVAAHPLQLRSQPDTGPGVPEPPPARAPSTAARPGAGERQSARAAEQRARDRSAEQQRARARAAQQQARARAAATKRATQLAQAAQRARSAWEARGRPTSMVVVRPDTVDLVTDGRLSRRSPRRQGGLTLAALDKYLPDSWLSIENGTAWLSATVVLTPRVTLDIGGEVTTLTLAGGATLPDAASIHTGGGRLVVHGATVTSADRASRQPMLPSPGRPFIVVAPDGRLDATDATFTDLGTSPADPQNRPGVQFNAGSSGSLVRTSLLRNGTGLLLRGSQDVRLEGVTVGGSTGDGLVLDDDRGTTMSGIRAERNAGHGVRVAGAGAGRPVTGITTTGNGKFGIIAVSATETLITGVTTSGDASGGLQVSRSRDTTVTGFTATDEPVGVFTHLGSTDTVLDNLTITDGRRGVVVEKTTTDLTVQHSTISGARVAGVTVGGTQVELRDVSVRGSRTGVRVERGADDVTAVDLTVSGGEDGLVATPGTTRVVLQNLTANGVENDAVRSFSPDARILGGKITGGSTGIALGAATTISGTSITLTDEGIRARSTGLVRANAVKIDAVSVGINAEAGSPVLLSGSHVHALEAVRGQLTQHGDNDLSLPPLNLLGAIGIPLILLALVLELAHAAREHHTGRSTRRRTPPTLPAAASPPRTSAPSARPTPSRTTSAGRVSPPGAAAPDAVAAG